MKKLTTLILILLCAVTLFAQAPEKFTYQAVVRNANNTLVANAQVGVRVNILQGTATGSAVYSETHMVSSNANGLVTLNIGAGSVLHGSFANIDWADGPYFLKTDIDPNGGNDYNITSTQQLLSVPYALYAKEAANSFSGDYNDLTNTPQIPTVPTNVSAFSNDAGYITSYTETDPVFNAWDKNYNDLTNRPQIPTVPTNVSAFNNDSGYITMDSVPTAVSAFVNDVPYLTDAAFQQNLAMLNKTMDSLSDRIGELEGQQTPPMVMTTGVSNVMFTTATVNGSVVFNGGAPVVARGFCYDTVMHPTVGSNTVSCGSGSGSFSANLLNLRSSTTYYVRAYATNVWGTNYGEEEVFTTLTEYAPSVEILPVSDITFTSFVCSGIVTDSGSYAVTARGLCWSTSPEPVMTGDHLHLGSGTGAFSATLTDMQPETTYYLRAYAVNAVGVTYSTQVTVATLTPTVPTVATDSVSEHNECTGVLLADGGTPVTQRGFCYARHPNPTLSDSVVIVNGTDSVFAATLSGLTMGLPHYACAFATNAKGTAYGNSIGFMPGCGLTPVTDYDGNVYNVLQFGIQCWMKENLRTTHYADGTAIEHAVSESSDSVAYYYYPDNRYYNQTTYGLLYNWPALMNGADFSNSYPSGVQGICPNGWHVPSAAEWEQFRNYVQSQEEFWCGNNSSYIAKALASTTGWNTASISCVVGNDTTSNNATGFTAMPAGCKNSYYGDFAAFGHYAVFWTSTIGMNNLYGRAYCISHSNYFLDVQNGNGYYSFGSNKANAFSLRCLRD